MQYLRNRTICWCLLGLFAFAGVTSAKIGWGMLRKKGIELHTRQPAVVRLANTTIAFTGTSTNPEYVPVQGSLMATLATELISNEKTLVVRNKPSESEWTLAVDVTGFGVPPAAQRREGTGNSEVNYTTWNGSLNVAYQVLDRSGRVHDAGNINSRYNKEFSSSSASNMLGSLGKIGHRPSHNDPPPATQEDVKQLLVRDVVVQIASKLGNTTKVLDVQVPAGEEHLDEAATFMTNTLWSRALEELQKAPAFPKPEEESFHQYDLGLVYEAMSYDSKDAAEQRANIFKASEYYDKALELNPREKYYVETVARTRDAMARYKALDAMLAEDMKTKAQNVKESPDARAVVNDSKKFVNPGGKPTTITDVIEMHGGGVEDEQIVEFIQSSKSVEFNPMDKDTMMAIAKAKLSIPVQNELRAKVGAPLIKVPQMKAAAKKTP